MQKILDDRFYGIVLDIISLSSLKSATNIDTFKINKKN